MTPDELVDLLMDSGAFGGRATQENAETPPPPCPLGVVHTDWNRAWKMVETLPAPERQAFADTLRAFAALPYSERTTPAFGALIRAIYARYRGRRIARNDRSSRTLIGARVPRAFAEQCKWAAQSAGLSTTQWCYRALKVALLKGEPGDQDGIDQGPAAWLL